MSDDDDNLPADTADQRRVLRALLGINAGMFLVEAGAGLLADSAGLLADSLDMLADAAVYALSLYAVGRAARLKVRAATLSGMLQLLLGLSVLLEAGRRIVAGSEPDSALMMATAALALAANVACMALLARHRGGEVHMRASWIFSTNDVIANAGVIASGLLVALSGSHLPDLLVATLIAVLVVRGGLLILREAREAADAAPG